MPKVAADFDKIIHAGRERKRHEALASEIFSRHRRQSAPASTLKPGTGPSLASRVGVKKVRELRLSRRLSRAGLVLILYRSQPHRTSLGSKAAQRSAGNINGEWTHDLHTSVDGSASLGARISAPGAKPNKRTARLAAALDKMDTMVEAPAQVNVVRAPTAPAKGLTIRGLAGPFAVMAQNFAPGTSAADIESAMTPVGGEMESCRIVKTSPLLIVEMVFASREGGERVIETFNDKTADGRLLKVYPKIAGLKTNAPERNNAPPKNAPSGPRSSRNGAVNDQVVDGSMGFPDLIRSGDARQPQEKKSLYSDRLVGSGRRGQGSQRGGRGAGRQ